jgi:tRNA(Ile)-lysidine synthetase-like protein
MILRFNDHMSVQNTFLTTVRTHTLLPAGTRLVVAVSGGADSLALLHLLYTHQRTLNCTLHVATLDHGLRGEAGASDAQYVADLAREWGIPATVGKANVAAVASEKKLGIEAAARRARYDFLAAVARESGADRVAVAHHADDQAETVLMHLLRGSGIEGLGGMAYAAPLPGHGDLLLIRPLLDVPRQQIESYCREHDLEPRHDVTNEDTRYTRNRLRREVLPYLETLYPQVKRSLAQLAAIAVIENDYIEAQFAERVLPHVQVPGERRVLPRQTFRDLHPALQRRFVRWAAAQLGESDDLGYPQIVAAVEIMLHGEVGALAQLPDGAQLRLDYDTVVVERSTAPRLLPENSFLLTDAREIPVSVPGITPLPDGWELHAQHKPNGEMQLPGACVEINPGAHVVLRARREGDRLAVQTGDGKRHTRRVSRWMIDNKIPQALRGMIPLLVVNGEVAAILWGQQWKVASSFTPNNVSTSILCLWLVNRND